MVAASAGINDGEHHAMELANLLHEWSLGGNVNLTLYNPISDSEFKRPFKSAVRLLVFRMNHDYLIVISSRSIHSSSLIFLFFSLVL